MSCFSLAVWSTPFGIFWKAWMLDQIITVDIHCGSYTLERVVHGGAWIQMLFVAKLPQIKMHLHAS